MRFALLIVVVTGLLLAGAATVVRADDQPVTASPAGVSIKAAAAPASNTGGSTVDSSKVLKLQALASQVEVATNGVVRLLESRGVLAAQSRLMEAMKARAPPEEVARLTDELAGLLEGALAAWPDAVRKPQEEAFRRFQEASRMVQSPPSNPASSATRQAMLARLTGMEERLQKEARELQAAAPGEERDRRVAAFERRNAAYNRMLRLRRDTPSAVQDAIRQRVGGRLAALEDDIQDSMGEAELAFEELKDQAAILRAMAAAVLMSGWRTSPNGGGGSPGLSPEVIDQVLNLVDGPQAPKAPSADSEQLISKWATSQPAGRMASSD